MKLNDISILTQCKNIQVQVLTFNNIDDLGPLRYCRNLQEQYLRKNNIQSLNQINYLKGLKNLRVLWLDENPLNNQKNTAVRLQVLKKLPQLYKFNNVNITKEERKEVEKIAEQEVGDLSQTLETKPGDELPELDYNNFDGAFPGVGDPGFESMNFAHQQNPVFLDPNNVNFVNLDDQKETAKSEATIGYSQGSLAQYANTNIESNLGSVTKYKVWPKILLLIPSLSSQVLVFPSFFVK